jgi:predicted ABC-type ATPase
VIEGGHYVEPGTIKGVYQKNLEHINEYTNTFKVIELYDGMKIPTLLARFENNEVTFAATPALKKKWIISGLPSFAQNIKSFVKKQ